MIVKYQIEIVNRVNSSNIHWLNRFFCLSRQTSDRHRENSQSQFKILETILLTQIIEQNGGNRKWLRRQHRWYIRLYAISFYFVRVLCKV